MSVQVGEGCGRRRSEGGSVAVELLVAVLRSLYKWPLLLPFGVCKSGFGSSSQG